MALCVLAGARAGETTIGITFDPTIGSHSEAANDRETLPIVPAPIFNLQYEQGPFALFLEGLPPIGPVAFSGTGFSHATGTKMSLISGSLRYRFDRSRFWVGVGETIINQTTSYEVLASDGTTTVPGDPTAYPVLDLNDQRDSSRVVGTRYEIGATLWRKGSARLDVAVAASPSMHARLDQWFSSTDASAAPGWAPLHVEFSHAVPEQAGMADAQIRWSRVRGRATWSLGLRYVNFAAKFDNGNMADRNNLVLPFAGWSTRL